MKIDGIQLREGSVISNLTVASGENFPANPGVGELFFRTNASDSLRGLYLYVQSDWTRISNEKSTVVPQGEDFPNNPVSGQLFYKDSNDVSEGLYFFDDETTSWLAAGGASAPPENLDASVITTGQFANDRISQASVKQHQASLVIAESQITDSNILARIAADETISGNYNFTGSPSTTTAAADDSTSRIASTAFVTGQASAISPLMDGGATIGTSKKYSREDHIHPTDTSRAPINNPTFTGTVAGISKSMVGLGNVDNTSDANKPVSTAQQTALNLKVNKVGDTMSGALTITSDATSYFTTNLTNPTSTTNAGYVWQRGGIDMFSAVITSNHIASNLTIYRVADSDVARAALVINRSNGNINIYGAFTTTASITGTQLVIDGATTGEIVGRKANAVRWTLYMPDSTAEGANDSGSDWSLHRHLTSGQAMVNTPVLKILRTNGQATFSSALFAPTAAQDTNTTQVATTAYYIGQAGTDMPAMALNPAIGTSLRFARSDHVHPTDTSRAPVNNPTFTGTVSGITKGMVGLGNVDNTSDANKPVSTAQQTALDLKYDKTGGTITGSVNIAGSNRLITGDFTSVYASDPLRFQSNVTDGRTALHIVPNGTNASTGYTAYNSSSKTNYNTLYLGINNLAATLAIGQVGSNAHMPFQLQVAGVNTLVVSNTGVVTFNTETNAPTPAAGDNSTKVATTAFVKAATMPVGAASDRAFFENDTTVTTSYTITTGKNAMSAGPITVANGAVVTVPNGSTWTVV